MTPAEADLQWVRPPQQTRSQETLERLLDAAEALIAEKGFEDTPVAEVARRAGSSVGAFYSRFKDKDALFHALYDRWLEQATATTDTTLDSERWRSASIPELLTAVVAFLVTVYRERGGLIRAFVVRNHVDPDFQARQQRLSLHISDRLTALLLERQSEIRHPHPERAARFGMILLMGALESVMLFGDFRSRDQNLDDETLAAELTLAYLAYLGVN
ncbi:MAG: TetR/AcrR family transcriptional regulator [Deltaproteobacteria bacterium]|nr:TetR/AcrR family transcriptional regulator [Deltaproteobacteria bacterium]MBW2419047.1 TetR/AcrR family transcriptional regulator [Deltaproteobacteria bacterium]